MGYVITRPAPLFGWSEASWGMIGTRRAPVKRVLRLCCGRSLLVAAIVVVHDGSLATRASLDLHDVPEGCAELRKADVGLAYVFIKLIAALNFRGGGKLPADMIGKAFSSLTKACVLSAVSKARIFAKVSGSKRWAICTF